MRNKGSGGRGQGSDDSLTPNKKLWGGRFDKSTDEMINDFQASINFDKRMYREDIAGSMAHAKMLAAQKIITADDAKKICAGLQKILEQIDAGQFEFSVALEDIHMNIELNRRGRRQTSHGTQSQ